MHQHPHCPATAKIGKLLIFEINQSYYSINQRYSNSGSPTISDFPSLVYQSMTLPNLFKSFIYVG